ncbi:MAG TPA: hypothetical protein VF306_00005, partial [Pirellulales bacterium]
PDATLLLHQIDEHIREIDQDFVPVAARAAEPVEAYRMPDPFGDHFEEEEVLIDRYASLDLAALDRHAQVASYEGRQLSAMLEPYLQAAGSPRLSIVDALEADELHEAEPIAAASVAAELLAAASFDSFSADTLQAADFGYLSPGFVVESTAIPAAAENVAVANGKPQGELPQDVVAETAEADDDLMIVEDDPRPEVHPFRRPEGAQVRRQEYRQLFSRLRRG